MFDFEAIVVALFKGAARLIAFAFGLIRDVFIDKALAWIVKIMKSRIMLAVIAAGIVAGAMMALLQQLGTTQYIMEAELLAEGIEQNGIDWARFGSTAMATILVAVGFAGLLAGVALVMGKEITAQNGLLWGAAAFAAFTFAPALGLPPELPGMDAATLSERQYWWGGTVIVTAIGLYLIAFHKTPLMMGIAAILISAPHLIGAPEIAHVVGDIPPTLSASYAVVSLGTSFAMWSLIGFFLGIGLDWAEKGDAA